MAATLPGVPGTPTRLTSTLTSLTLQWTEPVDNGGDPIRDYEVFWDQGLGASLVSLGLTGGLRTFTPAYTLVTGTTYRFRVKAINYIGTGPESAIGSLISAKPPGQPL